jgi:hypothetical protein
MFGFGNASLNALITPPSMLLYQFNEKRWQLEQRHPEITAVLNCAPIGLLNFSVSSLCQDFIESIVGIFG